MGLTKQYLRYSPSAIFGIIGSTRGGVTNIPKQKHLIASACAENVIIWNIKTGEKVATLEADKHEVTALCSNGDGSFLAVGYNNGSIRIFDEKSGECTVTLNGHKSAVTCIAYDFDGHRIVSGSRDTCVIIWDVINEAGLYRLQGHKGPVTNVAFMKSRSNVVVSSSKDTFIKFWDLNVQHCFKTLTGHLTEVWDFALIKNDKYIVTGTNDSELRIWKLEFKEDVLNATLKSESVDVIQPDFKKIKIGEDDEDNDSDEDEFDAGILKIERMGSVLRAGQDKLSHIVADQGGNRLVACHGTTDKSVELFLICNDEELKKRMKRKAKKERKRKVAEAGETELKDDDSNCNVEPTIQEEFRRLKVIKCSGKIRNIHVDLDSEKNLAVLLLSLANNQVEQYKISLDESAKENEAEKIKSFDHAAHRSDVRSVSVSSDNTAILSASHEAIKIWSRSTQNCIRTIKSGYGLCSFFVPGDRHAIIGTKEGKIQIFDIGSATMTEEVQAHDKEIWSMHMSQDQRGFVTASGDQSVKFWKFELISKENTETGETEGKQLSVIHTRTLKLEEDALAVRLSSDGRLVAVSLLDSTIKVFFVDTFKFFLSLYGHKLPALALDISTDNTLAVTGSADKNIKIWGLDFGDCHKSIFAHDDNITAVQFIPNTHMFFTIGKDGMLKQWDADNFQRILTLEAHHGEIWSLALSPNGKYVVTSGHDKTLRLWERTQEPLVLEDERETEREKQEDEQLATGEGRVVPGEQDKEAGLPSKKTAETEKGAERLMEAIEVYYTYKEEKSSSSEKDQPALPLLMSAYPDVDNEDDFIAEIVGRIKSSELEETLLVLPLDIVINLIKILNVLLDKNIKPETVSRIFFFLIEIHFGPLSASSTEVKKVIKEVRDKVDVRLKDLKDTVGFNLAAMNFVQNQRSERERIESFVDATSKFKEKRRKKKQKQKTIQTAIMTI